VVGSNAYVSGGFTSTTQAAGTTNWFFTDNQGSVRDVIQATVVSGGTSDAYVVATDVDNINYDPYGNIVYQSDSSAQPRFGYNGMQYDAATGMYYSVRRWYDPVNGDWLSQDPIGFAGGQTNTSEFVGNSPTNYTDPSGTHWALIGQMTFDEYSCYETSMGPLNALRANSFTYNGMKLFHGGMKVWVPDVGMHGSGGSSIPVAGGGESPFATLLRKIGQIATAGGNWNPLNWLGAAMQFCHNTLVDLINGAYYSIKNSTVPTNAYAIRNNALSMGNALGNENGGGPLYGQYTSNADPGEVGAAVIEGTAQAAMVTDGLVNIAVDGAGGLFGGGGGGGPAAESACYGGSCFVAGTPLMTPEGSKPIEEFKVGDFVLSASENDPTAAVQPRRVEQLFVRVGVILELRVAGRSIKTTVEHPFYVHGKGWQKAGALAQGDLLRTHCGSFVAVESIESSNEVATVYNLSIDEYHTYFVGGVDWGFSIWAHNASLYSLLGSDPAVAAEGAELAWGAKSLYTKAGLTETELRQTTVAIGNVIEDGQIVQKAVVNGAAPPSAVAKLRALEPGLVQAEGGAHAETYLYQSYGGASGNIQAIGVSHYTGPCPPCAGFFTSQKYFNVWWYGWMN
jgi:RHS repeat-associated protein